MKKFRNQENISKLLIITFKMFVNSIFFIFLISSITFHPIKVQAYESKDIYKLENKIAKSYSNKFCNAIGIGLSRDTAIKITIKENSNLKYNPAIWFDIAFNGEKKLNALNENSISEKIYYNISLDCSNAIKDLDKDTIEKFKVSLKSINIE